MAESTYTPLFSEIFEKVGKLKTKKQKVSYLKDQNTESLRMVIKSSFDPELNWLLPEGDVPFNRNDAPEGTEALPKAPLLRVISTSTVGKPLLSIISLDLINSPKMSKNTRWEPKTISYLFKK